MGTGRQRPPAGFGSGHHPLRTCRYVRTRELDACLRRCIHLYHAGRYAATGEEQGMPHPSQLTDILCLPLERGGYRHFNYLLLSPQRTGWDSVFIPSSNDVGFWWPLPPHPASRSMDKAHLLALGRSAPARARCGRPAAHLHVPLLAAPSRRFQLADMGPQPHRLDWHSLCHKICHPAGANILVQLLFCRFGIILVIFSLDSAGICENNRTFGAVFAHKASKLLPYKG